MGWKTKPYDYKWDHKKIDQFRLAEVVLALRSIIKPRLNMDKKYTMLMHHVMQIKECARVGSILIDLNYDAAFRIAEQLGDEMISDLLGEIYGIIDLGTLTQDHIDRDRKERAWMIEKGFTNG